MVSNLPCLCPHHPPPRPQIASSWELRLSPLSDSSPSKTTPCSSQPGSWAGGRAPATSSLSPVAGCRMAWLLHSRGWGHRPGLPGGTRTVWGQSEARPVGPGWGPACALPSGPLPSGLQSPCPFLVLVFPLHQGGPF